MIRRISNPTQYADNFLKIHDGDSPCCGDGNAICQYDVTYTQANTVSVLNILEDGAARALACVPATTSAADVKAAIVASLLAAGYEEVTDPITGVVVVDNGSTLTVTITGDAQIVSLTTSGGAATFNEDCTRVYLCAFATTGYAGGTTGTSATNLVINGVDHELGTITPGTTSAASVDTAVETAMTAAGVSGTATVTTTGSGGSQTYNITINATESSNTFILAGVYLERGACAVDFV